MGIPRERELIALLTETVEPEANRAGLTSDCAIVPLGEVELVATVDTFAATTHFPPGTPPHAAARLAANAALSDLAAAGADVMGLLVGCGLPGDLTEAQARRIGRTLAEQAQAHGGEVLGGDTKPRDELAFAITALGTCPEGQALTRQGARAGDRLVLSGALGGAGAALERVRAGLHPRKAEPLLEPEARVDAGRMLREVGACACVDLSDGLADGAIALAEASGVRCVVDASAVPLHPWAREADEGLDWALSTGGDYELLVAVPEDALEGLVARWKAIDLDPALVGRIEEGAGAVLRRDGEERTLARGYEHRFDEPA